MFEYTWKLISALMVSSRWKIALVSQSEKNLVTRPFATLFRLRLDLHREPLRQILEPLLQHLFLKPGCLLHPALIRVCVRQVVQAFGQTQKYGTLNIKSALLCIGQ
jgi:hypothetical protein